MAGWILEWRDDAEHLLEERHYLWLVDAENQVQVCLAERPGSHVCLLRRRMRSAGGTEANVLVRSFPATPGDPTWIETMPQSAQLSPPAQPLVIDQNGSQALNRHAGDPASQPR